MTSRFAIFAAAAVLLGAAVLTTVLLLRGRPDTGADRVEAQVGSAKLVYSPAYARFGPGRSGGRLDRVEMAMTFPDLRGAGRTAVALPSETETVSDTRQMVFLTLRPEDELVDPAERTAVLYARFLQPDVWSEDSGLVMRRFETGSPYEREELHFVPPEGKLFAARCVRPTQPPTDLPSTCLTTLRTAGLDIDIRFPPALLRHWEGLTDGVRKLVAGFVAS